MSSSAVVTVAICQTCVLLRSCHWSLSWVHAWCWSSCVCVWYLMPCFLHVFMQYASESAHQHPESVGEVDIKQNTSERLAFVKVSGETPSYFNKNLPTLETRSNDFASSVLKRWRVSSTWIVLSCGKTVLWVFSEVALMSALIKKIYSRWIGNSHENTVGSNASF